MTRNDVDYHLYPLGFLGAEDKNSGPQAGDGPIAHRLAKLSRWLDYFVKLGVTSLLLGSVFESESHGYDIVDPFRVDRRLGGENDLVELIDQCHQRGLCNPELVSRVICGSSASSAAGSVPRWRGDSWRLCVHRRILAPG